MAQVVFGARKFFVGVRAIEYFMMKSITRIIVT